MQLRRNPFLVVALTAVGMTAISSAQAASLTMNIDTEIVAMNLSGTGLIPLASDPTNALGDSIEGYGFVDTQFTTNESATETSTVTSTVAITTTDFLNFTVVTSSELALYLDMSFEDIDARPSRDFAAGLASPFSVPADPLNPISASLSSELLISFPETMANITITDLGTVLTADPYAIPLGVDVNGNAELDVMKLTADGLDFTMTDVLFTEVDISDDDLLIFAGGGDVVVDVNGSLDITSTLVGFSGEVMDAISDPPFTLNASGSTSTASVAVPEPSTALLLAMSLFAGLAYRARRRV